MTTTLWQDDHIYAAPDCPAIDADFQRAAEALTEIANLCAFLCTDASSGMTGQTIYVDAGCHAMA